MLRRLRLTFLTAATLLTTWCDQHNKPMETHAITNHTPVAAEVVKTTEKALSKGFNTAAMITRGIASWYGPQFHGKPTASGEIYDQNDMTAAHRTLPLGSWVRVTNRSNGHSVVVRINDRGPYVHGREIDLSASAFEKIGSSHHGTMRVKLEVLTDKNEIAQAKAANKIFAMNRQQSVKKIDVAAEPASVPADTLSTAPEPKIQTAGFSL